MDESLRSGHRAIDRGAIREIADDAVGQAGRRAAVEAAHGVAAPLEFGGDSAADPAGGTSDEHGSR